VKVRKDLYNSQIDVSSFQRKKFNMANIRSWCYGNSHQFSSNIESPVLRAGIFYFIKSGGTMSEEPGGRQPSGLLSADALRAAFQAQSALLEKFISMARSPDEPEVIKTMLRKTIEISIELTGAQLGSLVLLDHKGAVVDSILARGEISPELSSELVESVLKNGLAGWVMHHRKIGLVIDTKIDDRWLILRNQPYTARSALALPIISGEVLLGILTLKHSAPNHFTPEIVELMRITTTQVAMVLENACLFSNLNNSLQSLGSAHQKIEAYSRALDQEMEKCRQIQQNFLPISAKPPRKMILPCSRFSAND
jgi:sigma-B regulation protein RsbU (phosphoserine phosphatase)